VGEADFLAKLDSVATDAFDDQCTGANPRYPLIRELKTILLDSYYGRPFVEVTDCIDPESPVEKPALVHKTKTENGKLASKADRPEGVVLSR
jgi:acetaldehyde dehydrogenase/alcohol dehydrogenase